MPNLPPHLPRPATSFDEVLLEWQGRRRRALVHSSRGAAPERAAPLVLMLHGGGGSAELAALASRWPEVADRRRWIVAFPEGVRPRPDEPISFRRNPQFWSVRSGLADSEQPDVDDVGYLNALIDVLIARYPIDPRRVYASGFSNGGSMCFVLAASIAERLAAVAPVCGKLWRMDTRPARPVPVIYICGERDPLNPLGGGVVQSPWGPTRAQGSVFDTVRQWCDACGLDDSPTLETVRQNVHLRRFGSRRAGVWLDFYVILGAGHCWPGGIPVMNERIAGRHVEHPDATELIADFFADCAAGPRL